MTEWMLMDEALDYLKIQEFDKSIYRKKLESLHKHGKIRATRLMGIRYYDRASLDALRDAKATGGICAENQGSTSSETNAEISSLKTGISSISSEDILAVKLRAVESARKTMRQRPSSIHGALSASAQSQGSRINS